MKRNRFPIIASILSAVLLAVTPLSVLAEDTMPAEPVSVPLAPLLITELQVAGPNSATQEFIELYNTTDDAIVLDAQDGVGAWQLWYITSGKTAVAGSADYKAVTLGGTIPAHGHYLIAKGYAALDANGIVVPTAANAYLAGAHVDLTHSVDMAAAGNLWLVGPDAAEPCALARYDALGWGAAVLGEGTSAAAPAAGKSLGRVADALGQYVDTGRNSIDFVTLTGTAVTPGVPNAQTATTEPPTAGQLDANSPAVVDTSLCAAPPDEPAEPEQPPTTPGEEPPSVTEPTTPEPQDSTPQPKIPAANAGLKEPLLSEFLPNPASPLTDANDEFIELYNPNDAYFDLSGYALEVGLTTKRRYTIPSGTKVAPRTFMAFFSAQSKLALSNSGSQVALLDPLGRTLAQSEPYGTAKDGQAWVFANGIWQWTTKPTPNAVNVVSAPVAKTKSTSKKGASVASASTSKKGSSAQTGGQDSAEDTVQTAMLATSSSTPLHPGVLALIAGSAVLYGAYEYRRDVANRIYRFRTNRTTRREARQSTEGR